MSLSPLNVPIQIRVDAASWTDVNRVCPPELLSLNSSYRTTSVEAALLQTALCTRPPIAQGFSLSDLWAWLRYRPAFQEEGGLRLRPECNDIDAHQKTILSDELGMGFTIELLVDILGIQNVADTMHVLRISNPNTYSLRSSGKRGPRKAPDFLLTSATGEVSVLECKGTQSSRDVLTEALERGYEQKRNISRNDGTAFQHTLVGGLFIPQANKVESALIQIRDPEHEDIIEMLSGTETSVLQLAILQISLAKHLNLMGLHSWANILSTTPTDQLEDVRFGAELDSPVSSTDIGLDFAQTYFPPLTVEDRTAGRQRIVFDMVLSQKIFEILRDSPNVREALSFLTSYQGQHRWTFQQDGDRSQLFSPLGFTMSLEYR